MNYNDHTVDGVRQQNLPVFCVQNHPEPAHWPHDNRYLFDDFVALLEARREVPA